MGSVVGVESRCQRSRRNPHADLNVQLGGTDEIVVQGDNSDEIFDWVTEVGNVPEDNVDMIEDKKKKAG